MADVRNIGGMKSTPTSAGILLILGFLTSASHAAIISDTFDSGTGSWYRAGTVGTLTNTSGQLSWTLGGDQNRQIIGRSFTTTAVGVGETIRLSFDYTQTSDSVSILRVGLYSLENTITADGWAGGETNIGGSSAGFTTFIRDNSAAGNNARYEIDTINSNTNRGPLYLGTDIGTPDTTSYDINQDGSITYAVVFEVTRTSASSVSTLFTMSSPGGTHYSIAATTTAAAATAIDNFNMVGLRSGGGTMLIDNVVIEHIPEPSAALLAGVGMSALFFRRTRLLPHKSGTR